MISLSFWLSLVSKWLRVARRFIQVAPDDRILEILRPMLNQELEKLPEILVWNGTAGLPAPNALICGSKS